MKNKDEWLIFVTAGKWQSNCIKKAKEIGLKVLTIDSDKNAEGFQFSDHKIVSNFDNPELLIDKIKSLKLNYVGVLSICSDAGMLLAALIREQLVLPGPDFRLSKILTDKSLQRDLWEKNNIPGPLWKLYYSYESVVKDIASCQFPLIIKPVDSSGSRGVKRINSLKDDFKSAIKLAFRMSKSNKILIESFMIGDEYTVEVFIQNNITNVLAITKKKKIEATEGTVAFELSTIEESTLFNQITNVVSNSFSAVGYQDGPGHAELIIRNDGSPGMVEIAGRGGGFFVFDRLVPYASDVDVVLLTILQSVGKDLSDIKINRKSVTLRFIPSKKGIVISINGMEDANIIANVEAGSLVNIGDKVNDALTDGDRLAYIITTGKTTFKALELANMAEKLIKFEIGVINDN